MKPSRDKLNASTHSMSASETRVPELRNLRSAGFFRLTRNSEKQSSDVLLQSSLDGIRKKQSPGRSSDRLPPQEVGGGGRRWLEVVVDAGGGEGCRAKEALEEPESLATFCEGAAEKEGRRAESTRERVDEGFRRSKGCRGVKRGKRLEIS
ncbi:hypothetical protein HZH68_010263 [Vespula germanica]|uniref:Uncharacterized protein n=1 Tax=Vespula germanica TaxID=30212 RepID=A0A834JRT4_VESGE|nr:hypothetical protein HZH68_010263 [Vespula germanica]